ncbi:hypothetical protein M3Y96_00427800 [Aphelenchoides besseyi]|nr:hypothetical protein M3Y96_00427800 [Aphelenchoides besseyi]
MTSLYLILSFVLVCAAVDKPHKLGILAIFHNDDSGTVFRPDLYIEDFYSKDGARHHKDITKLYLSISAPATAHGNNRSVENFYAKSMRNLKRAAPDLRSLQIRGGYRFFPKHQSPEVFATEIRRLRKAIETTTIAAKNLGIKDVQFDKLHFELIHDKNMQKQVQTSVVQSVMDSFDVKKLELNERQSLLVQHNLDGRVCHMAIFFITVHREGYSRDVDLGTTGDTFGNGN